MLSLKLRALSIALKGFCAFCLSHEYDIKNKQHEVTFTEANFSLNFADGSVSFTLAQHKVKLGMFTASGELSIKNIDKGKYSNLGGSNNYAPTFAKDQYNAHARMRIHKQNKNKQKSIKIFFINPLENYEHKI